MTWGSSAICGEERYSLGRGCGGVGKVKGILAQVVCCGALQFVWEKRREIWERGGGCLCSYFTMGGPS